MVALNSDDKLLEALFFSAEAFISYTMIAAYDYYGDIISVIKSCHNVLSCIIISAAAPNRK